LGVGTPAGNRENLHCNAVASLWQRRGNGAAMASGPLQHDGNGAATVRGPLATPRAITRSVIADDVRMTAIVAAACASL
jgi:hypothetical protein